MNRNWDLISVLDVVVACAESSEWRVLGSGKCQTVGENKRLRVGEMGGVTSNQIMQGLYQVNSIFSNRFSRISVQMGAILWKCGAFKSHWKDK
ncbi:14124_t:CDS:2, partial [Gigaspora margarita]